MNKTLIESQEGVLYSTPPVLSIIFMLSSVALQSIQNFQHCNGFRAHCNYSNFEATYTIPCHVPNTLPLLASSNYTYLLKNATKSKDPTVKIIIIETHMQSQAERNVIIAISDTV